MTGSASTAVALVHAPKPRHVTPEHGMASFVNFVPFGLFSIASALRDDGFRPQIVHLGVERLAGDFEDFPAHLRREGVRLVGISLHWHPSTFDAIETARWLKRELDDVTVVFGGITASFFAEQLFEFDCVDHVVEGDGEVAFTALARALLRDGGAGLDAVPNLWRRGPEGRPVRNVGRHVDGATDLGRYDFGCFDLVKNGALLPYMNWALPAAAPWLSRVMRGVQDVQPRLKPLTFYPGRGCPIDCPICGGNRHVMSGSFGRSAYVSIPPRTLVAAAQSAIATGFSHLASDTSFGATRFDLLEMLDAFDEADCRPWWSMSLPTIPPVEVARELARVTRGQCWLSLTAESGSEGIRRRFRGPATFSNDELLAFLAFVEEAGIATQVVFSVNLPLDPASAAEHAAETRRLRARMRRSSVVTPVNYNLQLDPGSAMYRDPAAFDCEPLWRRLVDYYEANRQPDAGPGFLTSSYPHASWRGHRTHQIEMARAIVLNTGFRLGGSFERRVRDLLGAPAP